MFCDLEWKDQDTSLANVANDLFKNIDVEEGLKRETAGLQKGAWASIQVARGRTKSLASGARSVLQRATMLRQR